MSEYKKITTRQQQEEQQALSQGQAQQANAKEFQAAEDLLRHDALQTPVPPAIAQRLQESIAQLPEASRKAWWRRILGGSNQ